MAVGPIRGQEVRVNGPIGGPGQMRMDVGFPGQPGTGMSLLHLFYMLPLYQSKNKILHSNYFMFFFLLYSTHVCICKKKKSCKDKA